MVALEFEFHDQQPKFNRILDDIEMYEQQTPFELSDYVGLSYFLNNFLFRAIQENVFGILLNNIYIYL